MTEPRARLDALLERDITLVVKIGSSLLVDEDGQPRLAWMRGLAAALAGLRSHVILVSSGAIALGRAALAMKQRPASLSEAQACAAIGQIRLAGLWSDTWAEHGRTSAQVLLTVGDLEGRRRYLNARNTLETLLAKRVVPVVNENDTVATDEIRFGDNDRLSARVAQMAGADLLVLLSDVDGLYRADPKVQPDAERIAEVRQIDADLIDLAGDATRAGVGTGGMISKLAAARIATDAGCPVLLTSGRGEAEPLARFLETGNGTWFHAADKPLAGRKQWLRGLQQQAGELVLDAGAVAAVRRDASLLARGVLRVNGRFSRGELVVLSGPRGPLGQGLAGYPSDELTRIAGRHSDEFEQILGYAGRGAVVHRDDLVLFDIDRETSP